MRKIEMENSDSLISSLIIWCFTLGLLSANSALNKVFIYENSEEGIKFKIMQVQT